MMSDSQIKTEGMKVLVKNLGLVEASRFVMLMNREAGDYTEWRHNQDDDMSLEEFFVLAAEHERREKAKEVLAAANA